MDVIGLCAFSYPFNCTLGGNTEEGIATEKLLSGSIDFVRLSLEHTFPVLKLFPSAARNELNEAERIVFGLLRKVCITIIIMKVFLFR